MLTLKKNLVLCAKVENNIQNIQNGKYENTSIINRPDELGEISYAMRNMSGSIKDGINKIESLSDEIINTQKEIIYTMGEIAETRSKETGNHVKRVAEYSKLLALKLGIDEQTAEMLKLASPMHDIGKVGIPDNILNKPGKLTFEEFEIMKTHAQLGYEMLKHSSKPILQAAAIVSREHHEKYNGKGYPKGLSGENIHIFARITAVADVFDALGSDRVYKKAWEDDKIFELFNNERAEHFDPKIINIFFENIEEIKQIREQFKDL
jgi:response regulator RpfG family c-di-GMP phosphodiesterase